MVTACKLLKLRSVIVVVAIILSRHFALNMYPYTGKLFNLVCIIYMNTLYVNALNTVYVNDNTES